MVISNFILWKLGCTIINIGIFWDASESRMETCSGWWFGTFFIFPYIGDNHPNWLIFFRGVGIPPTSVMFDGSLPSGRALLSTKYADNWMTLTFTNENIMIITRQQRGFLGYDDISCLQHSDPHQTWQFSLLSHRAAQCDMSNWSWEAGTLSDSPFLALRWSLVCNEPSMMRCVAFLKVTGSYPLVI